MSNAQSAPAEPSSQRRVIDLAHLARQTMGDRSVEQEVLALFRRQARSLLVRLDSTTDPTGRREIAHALKGAARGIGAARVAAAAETLENSLSTPAACDALSELAASVSEACGEIEMLMAA